MTNQVWWRLQGILGKKILGPIQFFQALLFPVAVVFIVSWWGLDDTIGQTSLVGPFFLFLAHLLTSLLGMAGLAILFFVFVFSSLIVPGMRFLRKWVFLPILRPTRYPKDGKRLAWMMVVSLIAVLLFFLGLSQIETKFGKAILALEVAALAGFLGTYQIEKSRWGKSFARLAWLFPNQVFSDGTIRSADGTLLRMAVIVQTGRNVALDPLPVTVVQGLIEELLVAISDRSSPIKFIVWPDTPYRATHRQQPNEALMMHTIVFSDDQELIAVLRQRLQNLSLGLRFLNGVEVLAYIQTLLDQRAGLLWTMGALSANSQSLPSWLEFGLPGLLAQYNPQACFGKLVGLPTRETAILRIETSTAHQLAVVYETCYQHGARWHMGLFPIEREESLAFRSGRDGKSEKTFLDDPRLREFRLVSFLEIGAESETDCQKAVREICAHLTAEGVKLSPLGGFLPGAQELMSAFGQLMPTLPDRRPNRWQDWLDGGTLLRWILGEDLQAGNVLSSTLAQCRGDGMSSAVFQGTHAVLVPDDIVQLGWMVAGGRPAHQKSFNPFIVPHMLVVGGQGYGKTTLGAKIIAQVLESRRAVVIVFDLRPKMKTFTKVLELFAPGKRGRVLTLPSLSVSLRKEESLEHGYERVLREPPVKGFRQQMRHGLNEVSLGDMLLIRTTEGGHPTGNPALVAAFEEIYRWMRGPQGKMFLLCIDEAGLLGRTIQADLADKYRREAFSLMIKITNEARAAGGDNERSVERSKVMLITALLQDFGDVLRTVLHFFQTRFFFSSEQASLEGLVGGNDLFRAIMGLSRRGECVMVFKNHWLRIQVDLSDPRLREAATVDQKDMLDTLSTI